MIDRYVELARSYAVAASFTALAVLLRWIGDPWLDGSFRFTMVYGAVALAVRYCGTGPGVFAGLLGYAASVYLFTQPGLAPSAGVVRQSLLGFAPYAVSCAIIIGLAAGLRRANSRAMEDARELRAQREQLQLENLHRAEAEQAALEANRRLSQQVADYGRAEAALRASEERFRVALESSAVPFAILHAIRGPGERIIDFEWLYLNPAAARVIDRPVEALVGQRIAELFPWSWDVPGLFDCYCRAVETGEPQAIEVHSSPGGVDMWVHNISTRFGDGVAVWFADVTGHRRAELAAREARAQLQTVTDLAPAGMARCSRDFRYLWVNRQFADWLDQPPEDLAGRSLPEVLGETAFTAFLPHYQTVLAGHRVEHEQQVNMARLGPRWVNASYVPTYGADGTIDGWVAVVTDVTQRKRLELALLEADRRKDEFLAVLAHELRNPLAPMRTALEYIRLKSNAGDPLTGAHEIIHRQLAHMSRLVDDLLDLSRVTQGRIQLKRSRVALAVVIGQAVESSVPIIEAAGHELDVRLPSDAIFIEADVTRLAQVIGNLLNNAAKYTPRGGRIALRAARERDEVVIEVEDTGVGIPKDMLPYIFDMFVQVDRSLDRTQGGLGIGLTLVRRLVQMHGGSVEAHSEGLGSGSTFRVRLPVASAEWDGERPTPAALPAAEGAGRRVLIVDDNIDAAESLGLLLAALGHEVELAYDGVQALTKVGAFNPEIVLLDIGLPHMNGYEVARRIKHTWGADGPLLIALTGWGQDEDRRQAREAGFDHHLTKPVEISVLAGLIGTCVPAEL